MSQMPTHPSIRQRLFASLMAGLDETSLGMYQERKTRLLSPLRGTIVEIGPGTGVNLQFLNSDVQWIGMEPNRAMHPHIQGKARKLNLSIEIRTDTLGDSGITPGTVDVVISTLVLCSVPSVSEVLQEVLNVLKPGGTFAFLEHVGDRPLTLRRFIQKTAPFTPWRYFSDGCHPGRDIGDFINHAGFSKVEFESYMQEGPGLILAVNRPHICGFAIK